MTRNFIRVLIAATILISLYTKPVFTQVLFSAPAGQNAVKAGNAIWIYDDKIVRGNASTVTLLLFSDTLPAVLELRLNDDRNRVLTKAKAELSRVDKLGFFRWNIAIPALSIQTTLRASIQTLTGNTPPAIPDFKVTILERNYRSETIPLSPSMTSLRASPDPRKDAESAEYAKILDTIDQAHGNSSTDLRVSPFTEIRRTAFFGDRRIYAYSNGTTEATMHFGYDYGGNLRPIYAPADGEIVFAAPRIVTGNTVILAIAPGVYNVNFHMDSISVTKGMVVKTGQLLGLNGATGLVTGPHLHWELRVQGVAAEAEFLLESRNLDSQGLGRLLSLPVNP